MLWKLVVGAVISSISIWQHIIGFASPVLKTTFLHRCSDCIRLCSTFCLQTSQAIKAKEKRYPKGSGGRDPRLKVNRLPTGTKSKRIIIFAIVIAAVAAAVVVTNSGSFFRTYSIDLGQIGSNSSENGEPRAIVPLDKIVGGGPPQDGIPSIDNPKFISAAEAEKILQDAELVVGLNINGDIRAYPLQILVWHEIVNDNVGGSPVAVTYCPLCFTNQVFKRTIDGQIVDFGTSGKLYNSNLVMYDRTSETLWSQALGQGIVGKYAGVKLDRIPFDVAFWKEWKQLYPDTKVLSRDTGSTRPYGADPYGDYYTSNDLFFPVSNKDDRLGLKEVVVGLENEGQYKAYKVQQIEDTNVINDSINGKSVVLFSIHPAMVRVFDSLIDGQKLDFQYDENSTKITDKQTGSEWNLEGIATDGPMEGKHLTRLPFDEGFWFEWVAFHPETEVYPG